MATVQLRNPPEGRAYFNREKADGKSSNEAMRCLKRRLSDAAYREATRQRPLLQRDQLTAQCQPLARATSRTRHQPAQDSTPGCVLTPKGAMTVRRGSGMRVQSVERSANRKVSLSA
jgi:hypothetical protein